MKGMRKMDEGKSNYSHKATLFSLSQKPFKTRSLNYWHHLAWVNSTMSTLCEHLTDFDVSNEVSERAHLLLLKVIWAQATCIFLPIPK